MSARTSGARAGSWPRHAVLLLLVAGFGILKARFDPGLGTTSLDGSYYFQIARHVSQGEGLVSSISLYQQGFQSFPHPVNQSPVWLLLLGHLGRVFGLLPTALVLPEWLYLADLVLLYFLANRLFEALPGQHPGRATRPGRIPDFGHLAVLFLGLNPVLFRYTSLPYTEALSFGLLFAALLVADRAARRESAAASLLAGLLAGLGLLTRSQLLGLALALPAALAWTALRERRFPRLALACAAGTAASLLPWVLYLATWNDAVTLSLVVGQAHLRETPGLRPFEDFVVTSSAWEFIRDRAGGLAVAFHPRHAYSYVASFGWSTYLVPLAGAAALWQAALGALRLPAGSGAVLVLGCGLAGLAMIAPVHVAHATFYKEWLFSHRHGLPFALLVLLATAWLLRQRSAWLRGTALAIFCFALFQMGWELRTLLHTRLDSGLNRAEQGLAAWIDEHPEPPVIVTPKPQVLALGMRAGFHWIHCREGFDQTLTLLEDAGADYVLWHKQQGECPYLSGRHEKLERVRGFGVGDHRIVVLRLAGRPGPAAP